MNMRKSYDNLRAWWAQKEMETRCPVHTCSSEDLSSTACRSLASRIVFATMSLQIVIFLPCDCSSSNELIKLPYVFLNRVVDSNHHQQSEYFKIQSYHYSHLNISNQIPALEYAHDMLNFPVQKLPPPWVCIWQAPPHPMPPPTEGLTSSGASDWAWANKASLCINMI